MQGLVPFNRAPLWKNFPNHERKEPQRSPPDKKSQVEAAERCVERMSIPGAPGLRVIARSSDLTFDVTFDGSPESFARAPLNMMKLDEVYKSLENLSNHGMNDDQLNVVKQLVRAKQEEIMKSVVTTTRKQRNTRRHDRYDEATAPAMARLLAARQKREKTKKRTHDAAQDGCDARFKDNTDDIQFLAALHKRLEDTGSLEKALTKNELMKVMRAKRIPLPQGPTADILRDKLKEVDERLYEANMECTRVVNARRPKRANQTGEEPLLDCIAAADSLCTSEHTVLGVDGFCQGGLPSTLIAWHTVCDSTESLSIEVVREGKISSKEVFAWWKRRT